MQEITQDQRGFSGGIVSTSEIAKFDPNVFFSSGRNIKNFDVQRDGSLRARRGFGRNFGFSNFQGEIVKSLFFNDVYFFLSDSGTLYFSQVNAIYPLQFDGNKLKAYSLTGSLVIDADLSTSFIKYPTNITVTDIQKIGDQVVVFGGDYIPFKVFFSGDAQRRLLVVAPFFAKSAITTTVDNIWDKFPFYKTNDDLESADFFYQKIGANFFSVSPPLKPKLTIIGEDLEAGECFAFIDPGYEAGSAGLANNFYVDTNVASMFGLLRQPILLSVGNRSLVQNRVLDEASKSLPSDNAVVSKIKAISSSLSSTLTRVGAEVYGATDYFSWNLEVGIQEPPLFLSSSVVNPLFFALGFRFYCIIPYEHVPTKAAVESFEGKEYSTCANYYTEALKGKHGGGGGSGYMKCKIYELGWQTKRFYSGKRIIGGRDFSFHASDINQAPVNYTDNWIVNDWIDNPPNNGGFLRDKAFYFTEGGKLSISKLGEHTSFSNAIKVLLNSSNYNYVYNNVPYSTKSVAPRDYVDPSRGVFLDYLKDVSVADDSLVFNLADAFTYRMRDENGDSPQIRDFKLMNIGSLNPSGVQVVTSTDSGIYFWGFDYNGNDPSSFLNLVKVSSFIVKEDVGILEAYNKIYLRGENREGVFYVSYSNDFRAFNSHIANETSFSRFNDIRKLIKFGEFRVGIIDRDSEGFGRFFVGNVMPDGKITGISEYTIKNREFVDVFKRGDFYVFVVRGTVVGEENTYDVVQYAENITDERRLVEYVDDFNGKFTAEFEDCGFAVDRKYYPLQGDFVKKAPFDIIFRTEGVDDLQFAMGDTRFVSLSKYLPTGSIKRVFNRVSVKSAGNFTEQFPGVRIRQQSGNTGIIGGYTTRVQAGESS